MREHGDFRIFQLTDTLLWNVVEGAINRECAAAYGEAMAVAAQPLVSQPWVRVTDIRHWQLCGPEAIPPLTQWMQVAEARGLRHSINIVSMHNLQEHLLNLMMSGVERHSVRHVVESVDEAIELLRQLGLSEPSADQLAAIYPHGWQ